MDRDHTIGFLSLGPRNLLACSTNVFPQCVNRGSYSIDLVTCYKFTRSFGIALLIQNAVITMNILMTFIVTYDPKITNNHILIFKQ